MKRLPEGGGRVEREERVSDNEGNTRMIEDEASHLRLKCDNFKVFLNPEVVLESCSQYILGLPTISYSSEKMEMIIFLPRLKKVEIEFSY